LFCVFIPDSYFYEKILKLALSVCISGLFTTASADESVCPKEGKFPVAELKTRVLVIGEMHGSNEYPAFAKSVVCQLLAANKPVILGLEIPKTNKWQSIIICNRVVPLKTDVHCRRGILAGQDSGRAFQCCNVRADRRRQKTEAKRTESIAGRI
jgi:hypothetical protein